MLQVRDQGEDLFKGYRFCPQHYINGCVSHDYE